ncbi:MULTISPECIES: hypothetical protein [Plantibacter]|uniref:hypothetical protein n=1 Tax=Plantibacter TaxID=190323 RepID=UPI00254EAF7D|nr:hypothetical protein [Plantibacter sp. lyk4-40-MEA-4]
MDATVTTRPWQPPIDTLPDGPQPGIVYILPRMRDGEGRPAFHPENLTLVKSAVTSGARLDYALPPDERRFVDHFSAESTLELWLALSGPITDVVLFGLGYMIDRLLHNRGSSRSDIDGTAVTVRIAQYNPDSGAYEGLEVIGPAEDVIATVEALKRDN